MALKKTTLALLGQSKMRAMRYGPRGVGSMRKLGATELRSKKRSYVKRVRSEVR